ncbi:MAG: DUF2064 domain-containing protein, partial [Acidimicrobiales bacterium]
MNLLVVAKAPVPGRSKTRLCPPCTPLQAAAIAEAALADTLDVVVSLAGDGVRPVLALDGFPGPWLPAGFVVVAQRGGSLDERLVNAWADAGGPGPGLQIGMDTPQVTPELLSGAMDALSRAGIGAALGLADDGGWWALGLRRPDWRALLGVAMSTPGTGAAQRRRLDHLGLAVAELPQLRDVDHMADALAVATEIPGSRFARTVASVTDRTWGQIRRQGAGSA